MDNRQKVYHWMNDEIGQLHTNLWDLTKFLTWYFFYSLKRGFNPVFPGKWKYSKKGW